MYSASELLKLRFHQDLNEVVFTPIKSLLRFFFFFFLLPESTGTLGAGFAGMSVADWSNTENCFIHNTRKNSALIQDISLCLLTLNVKFKTLYRLPDSF